jgi:hypothetical protein
MEFLVGGTILPNLPQGADIPAPAKIFGCLPYNAWRIVLAKGQSATPHALHGTSAHVVDANDVVYLAATIEAGHQQYAKRESPVAAGQDRRIRVQAAGLIGSMPQLPIQG